MEKWRLGLRQVSEAPGVGDGDSMHFRETEHRCHLAFQTEQLATRLLNF